MNPPFTVDPHDRTHVRLLHHAHADHIESLYRGMLAMPGNPAGVVMKNVDGIRTFIANGQRLENRAIFNGDETPEQVDSVLRHFADHRCNCVIEVNPASAIQDFRCVWSRFHATVGDEGQLCHVWRRFDAGQLDEFIIFTVTDFNYSSPANLQRCGTRLAYNYLLVRRDPLPL